MKNTGGALKERLLSIIEAMGEHPERYAKNPGKDFTRWRSLTLPTLISLILTMDKKSMRKKLLPQAFEDLFHRFTDTLTAGKRF